MVAVKCLVIFEFGTFLMLFPLTKDVKIMLKSINLKARRKKEQPIGKLFLQLIQFHSKLIQLSHSLTPRILLAESECLYFVFTIFRLVHDYSEFSSMVFGLILSWTLAGICTMMILLHLKMVGHFELLIYWYRSRTDFVFISAIGYIRIIGDYFAVHHRNLDVRHCF